MVQIKLIKGLSYSGLVTATAKKPYLVTDEKTAQKAAATGYFEIVAGTAIEEPKEDTGGNDKTPVTKPSEKMTKAELEAYAKSKGIDISDCTNNGQRIALIKEVEAKSANNENPDGEVGSNNSMTPGFTQE